MRVSRARDRAGEGKRASGTPTLFDLGREGERPASRATLYARVALNRPVRREFTYAVADELAPRLTTGARVAVRFGPRRQVGVVVGLEATTDVPPENSAAISCYGMSNLEIATSLRSSQ